MLIAKIGIVLMLLNGIIERIIKSGTIKERGQRIKFSCVTVIYIVAEIILVYRSGMFSTGT